MIQNNAYPCIPLNLHKELKSIPLKLNLDIFICFFIIMIAFFH